MDTETVVKLSKVRALTESGAARSIRVAARLSLPDVAAAIDSHPTTIWRWEAGHRQPHGEVAIRYGDFLQSLMDSK